MRDVALKQVQPRFAEDQDSRRRFVLEAELPVRWGTFIYNANYY